MQLRLRNVEGGIKKNKNKNKKQMFVLSSSLRIPDSYLLLESPKPLSPPHPPPQGPWTSYEPASELTLSFPLFF